VGETLRQVETEDLLRFGFIPEFIGRFPIVSTLDGLEESDLVRILTEPRNALVKQYERFFEMEHTRLEFSTDALKAIAEAAIKKGTGARALRSILETMMLDVMYEIPSQRDVSSCRITREVVEGKVEPELVRAPMPVIHSA
jgi:ATP-dependent Clp protease ATP-binding subunit ClpX